MEVSDLTVDVVQASLNQFATCGSLTRHGIIQTWYNFCDEDVGSCLSLNKWEEKLGQGARNPNFGSGEVQLNIVEDLFALLFETANPR